MDLYNSTNGSNWTENSGWLTDSDPCSWYGVVCVEGHVTTLWLVENNLSGTIPSSIGNLVNLERLVLRVNKLNVPIPPELGDLANLAELNLSWNQFTGAILPELGNLTNLESLSLMYNQLNGPIPPELGDLENLKNLLLRINQLTGPIPPELGDLSNLFSLYLSGNQLTGPIPPELGNLTNLSVLDLARNQFIGRIPPELGDLSNLHDLKLYNNQLTGNVPIAVASLVPNPLSSCDFSGNDLCIPDTPEYQAIGEEPICRIPLTPACCGTILFDYNGDNDVDGHDLWAYIHNNDFSDIMDFAGAFGIMEDNPCNSASIGDYVWLDTDGDGIQDTDEGGLKDVIVVLENDSRQVIAVTQTGVLGAYKFNGIPPGNYWIRFVAPDGFLGYAITLRDQGGDDTVDSDADRDTGYTTLITVGSDEHNDSIDAGFAQVP